MVKQLLHPAGDLIRYLDGDLVNEDRRKIEAHLASCAECREQLAFTRDFNQSLAQLTAEELSPREPCPRAEMLVRYEGGKVDKETAEHLRAHMLFCNACRDGYYALRRLRGPSWTRVAISKAEKLVALLSLSGSGSALSPAYGRAPTRSMATASANQVRVGSEVADSGSGEASFIGVIFEPSRSLTGTKLQLEADPPRAAWQVRLFDENQKEIASMPISVSRITLDENIQPGTFVIEARKGDVLLATFDIEITSPKASS